MTQPPEDGQPLVRPAHLALRSPPGAGWPGHQQQPATSTERTAHEATTSSRNPVVRLWRSASRSVRTRVLLPTSVLFTAVFVICLVSLVGLYGRNLQQNHEKLATGVATTLQAELLLELSQRGPKYLQELMPGWTTEGSIVRTVNVVRPDGSVAFSSDPKLVGTVQWGRLDGIETPQVINTGDKEFAIIAPLRQTPACARCHPGDEEVPGYVDTRFARRPIQQAKSQLARTVTLVVIPTLLCLLAVTWWLLGREVTKPLKRLMAAMRLARTIAPATADEGRPDELGAVARSFDDTMAALRRTQAEAESFYRERLLHVDRFAAIGELATGLAHEIKTPLAGISSALELFAEDLQDRPEEVAVIGEMQAQLTRLNRTMESMLSFARPPKIRLRPVDVNESIDRILFVVDQQVRKLKANIEVYRELDEELPLAFADSTQLEQALMNISLNAIQAMAPAPGELTVQTRADGDWVIVEVIDTGPGIPEPIRPHIFEPYFTTKPEGTGLGLALSARIIADHGGTIDYESRKDHGTCFRLRLRTARTRTTPAATLEEHHA